MNDFLQLGIRRELNEMLRIYGITEPTPIQKQTIPTLLSGKDVIAQAQTGTGKTLAFVLPILERIDAKKPYIQALILTPTRELALQITTELKKLASKMDANVLAVYGGQDVERQNKKLQGNTHIVIATPGRLLDHVGRGTIRLTGVSMLVLDEADQMLHMGFLNDVEKIIHHTSPKRQTMLFSATIPPEIRALSVRYMRKPMDIHVQGTGITLEKTKQIVVETTDRTKQETLCKLLDEYQPYLGIIFCRTKRRASALNEALIAHGYNSDELHGDLSQAKREQVMKRFREAKLQILVATDVAARGLDVEGVTHVFNYDIPHDVESYIHRIGRTGRAGDTGLAVTFVSPRDRMDLQMIEKGIGMKIEKRSAHRQTTQDVPSEKTFGRKSTKEKDNGRDKGRKSFGSYSTEKATKTKKPLNGKTGFKKGKKNSTEAKTTKEFAPIKQKRRKENPLSNKRTNNKNNNSRGKKVVKEF